MVRILDLIGIKHFTNDDQSGLILKFCRHLSLFLTNLAEVTASQISDFSEQTEVMSVHNHINQVVAFEKGKNLQ